MNKLKTIIIIFAFGVIGFVGPEIGQYLFIPETQNLIPTAEARVGRPLTPVSVAGVARRTTRRVVRRTAVYVAALPTGCTTVVIEGATLYQCGGTYYQAYQNQYEVVVIE